METFRNLIETHETWLAEKALEYALAHGYAADSSTLEEPWRASICGLSEPMLALLLDDKWPPEINRDPGPQSNYLTTFTAHEANLHRQRGVSLDQFLGLTKYYRRAYLELVSHHVPPGPDAERYKAFIDLFFDNTEIGICAEWERHDTSVALREAADTNRLLTNEKNRYLTIFESLHEPVILLDNDEQVTNLNLAANQLFNDGSVSGEGYYGQSENLSADLQIATLIKKAGDASELEHQMETPRGMRTFHVKIQPMLDVSEKFTGKVIILSDITGIRAAERASDAANRAKSTFLATMSHEIRTPINGILGISQLLKEAPLEGVHNAYIDALLSSGELLLDLVNDVLDYSKLDAGDAELQETSFSPRDMVERIALLSIGEAQRKGLQLNVEIDEDCPLQVMADHGKIQRILLNLINNAVKFTQAGSVSISIRPRENQLCFTVRDTGPGIPQADHTRVFEPFVQRPVSGMELPVGTGLGLAICRRLAHVLGAELTLESSDRPGAVFQLDCPVAAVDTTGQNVPPENVNTGALDILLVEDNAINAMVTEGFLESDGHRVDTVTSGEAALERLSEQPYELVLMDIRLQGFNGFEAIQRIRDHADAAVASLPILILTADNTDEVARLFVSSGANAFQAKPFSHDELSQAVWRAMGSVPVTMPRAEQRMPGNVSRWDKSVIAEHLEVIGPERTQRILETFLETASQHKSALREAASAGDGKAMADIAHGLRSAAEMTGLKKLSRTADDTERRIVAGGRRGIPGDKTMLSDLAEALCDEIGNSMDVLRQVSVVD